MKKKISLILLVFLPLVFLLDAAESSEEFSLSPKKQELIHKTRLHHKELIKKAPQSTKKELRTALAEERKTAAHSDFFATELKNDDVFLEEEETPQTICRIISRHIPFPVRQACKRLTRYKPKLKVNL